VIQQRNWRILAAGLLAAAMSVSLLWQKSWAQSAPPEATPKPYLVEWVYRVKWGNNDEWWKIFQKYQVATLDRETEEGSVLWYQVFRPGLHTSEDQRWDYRVIIAYKDISSPSKASAIEHKLFPDRDLFRKEENRRWELTAVHWDLPIHEIDPHATE